MTPLTLEIGIVLAVTLVTIILFITEWLRVDVIAILVLVTLGLLTQAPGLETLISSTQLFSGFSSNAVMSIIAIMIIGAGLDRAGLMSQIAGAILRLSTNKQAHIMLMITGTVGIISSFMQNVGAAALFLPVTSRISIRTGINMSRLLMPMGFCAILGGTVTMIGSGPLILLNDLLPGEMEKFGLLDVTPLGLSLLTMGILYFLVFGYRILPREPIDQTRKDAKNYFRDIYGVDSGITIVHIGKQANIEGWSIGKVENTYSITIIAMHGTEIIMSPHRALLVGCDMNLALMASQEKLTDFVEGASVIRQGNEDFKLAEALSADNSGIAEVIIKPNSELVGKTIREIRIRKTFGITPLAIIRSQGILRDRLREVELQVGDTLLCYISWEDLMTLERNPCFAILTSEYPKYEHNLNKLPVALVIFAVTFSLVLLTDIRLSLALMTGAIIMVIAGVLSMDEAYKAVSWKTVFLLAGLIPLGVVSESTGAAAWAAERTLSLMGDTVVPLMLYFAALCLATVFSLIMSNIGATVILVPLIIQMALNVGADPRLAALLVAVGVSNTFLIPTHQVNALIMGPGGYRVVDFMRAGSMMTILFIVTAITAVTFLYP